MDKIPPLEFQVTKPQTFLSPHLSNHLTQIPHIVAPRDTKQSSQKFMLSDQLDPLDSAAAEPLENNLTPAGDKHKIRSPRRSDATSEDPADPPRPKRNCGRTGPTSAFGRATSSRNATRHGLCSETLILSYESEAKWLELLACWLSDYQNPADNSLLYTFVVKAAQAEWFRQRAQKEYDFFLRNHNDPPMYAWTPQRIKEHDLLTRYVNAERRFQRDYRTLEQHW